MANNQDVELNGGKIILHDGRIIMNKTLETVQCPCGGKAYYPLVEPVIANGSARLILLVCMNCSHAVEITGDAIVGDKQKVYVDKEGKRHHRMRVEGGLFGPASGG